MLLVALILAALLRLVQIGEWPPGLYRDEAINGLDALGVLQGQLAIFFTDNNGREPLYIYLVALAIAVLGRSVLAVRLPAALTGIFTTVPTYLLGRAWFGPLVGLLAAFIWAITFWPVHLSRIGLRAIVFAPVMAVALWLGTRAYRSGRSGWWLVAGLAYGLTFYTYLAARFTPLFLLALALYLWFTGRRESLWSGGRSLWFVGGAALVVAPLGILALQEPAILLGRTGQVSIFSPSVNGGDFLGTLARQTAEALGMFVWRGDPILRHNALFDYAAVLPEANPAGRPVFDLFLVGPFLLGVGWCLARWRKAPAAALLLWQLIMLGPTILAADAPHFLRAAGLLPGTVFFPAIGLGLIWRWGKLPVWARQAVVIVLLAGSLLTTMRTYSTYGRQPDVAYLFEDAAAQMGVDMATAAPGTAIYVDTRFWEGWPSIPFLVGERPVTLFEPGQSLPPADRPATIFAWPYSDLETVRSLVTAPGYLLPEAGPLARGDLEPTPYSLYSRFAFEPVQPPTRADNFAYLYLLRDVQVTLGEANQLLVTLKWEQPGSVPPPAERPTGLPVSFVHVLGPEGLIAQHDAALAAGLWPAEWWTQGLVVGEHHTLTLPVPLDPANHRIVAGLYWPETVERLPLLDSRYNTIDDQTTIWPPPGP